MIDFKKHQRIEYKKIKYWIKILNDNKKQLSSTIKRFSQS